MSDKMTKEEYDKILADFVEESLDQINGRFSVREAALMEGKAKRREARLRHKCSLHPKLSAAYRDYPYASGQIVIKSSP